MACWARSATRKSSTTPRAKLIDMLIPILVLIVCCIVGMMFVGGFWDPEAEGFGDLALAFGNTDASVGLPWGSIIALVFTFIYLLCRRVITFGDAAVCIVDGFKAMVPALLILTFALTLKPRDFRARCRCLCRRAHGRCCCRAV